MLYAFTENFILPFSTTKWFTARAPSSTNCRATRGRSTRRSARCTASLRASGKKLLFMGGEFGQWREWNHDRSLDWHLLDDPSHGALRRYVQI